jgi:sugar/nucleoside kinase (ribokinase family)
LKDRNRSEPIITATEVIDTTGAGDTFTSAFAVALVEGKAKEECMRFTGIRRTFLLIFH